MVIPMLWPTCHVVGNKRLSLDGYRKLNPSYVLRFLRLWITPRRIHPLATLGAREAAGLAGADDYQGAHIDHLWREFAEG